MIPLDIHFIKHYYRMESDEDLQIKLVFTDRDHEKDMLKREIERRAKENGKPSERVL